MSIKDYLLDCLINEKEIIEELLYIDNNIQHTALTYDYLIESLKNVNECNINNDFNYIAITDGEVEAVFKVLISVLKLKVVFVDKRFLALNKYLVSRVNLFLDNDDIELDLTDDYRKYIGCNTSVVISGIEGFTNEVFEYFDNSVII